MCSLRRFGGGGGGAMVGSQYSVPQEGFLLFASNSMRSMPGDVKVRRVCFRNFVLTENLIMQQYVASTRRKRPKPISPDISLSPLLKKKAGPIWLNPTFIAEFCNPFVPGSGGDVLKMYQVFAFALEGTSAEGPRGGGAPAEGPPPPWGPGGGRSPRGLGKGEAPKDFTKPRQTLQSSRKTIDSPDRLYKALEYYTKHKNIRQEPKIFNKSSKQIIF